MFTKLHTTAQSGPVILVILCHSHWSSQEEINDTCVCMFAFHITNQLDAYKHGPRRVLYAAVAHPSHSGSYTLAEVRPVTGAMYTPAVARATFRCASWIAQATSSHHPVPPPFERHSETDGRWTTLVDTHLPERVTIQALTPSLALCPKTCARFGIASRTPASLHSGAFTIRYQSVSTDRRHSPPIGLFDPLFEC